MAKVVIETLVLLTVIASFQHFSTEAQSPTKVDKVRTGFLKKTSPQKFVDGTKEDGSTERTDVKETLKTPNETRKGSKKDEDGVAEHDPKQLKEEIVKGKRSGSGSFSKPVTDSREVPPTFTEKEVAINLQAFRRYLRMKLRFEGMKEEEVPYHLNLPPLLDMEGIQADDGGPVSLDGFHAKPNTAYVWATDVFTNCSDTFDYACLGFESLNHLSEKAYVKSARLWLRGVSTSKMKLILYSLKKVKSPKNKTVKMLEKRHFLSHFSLSSERMGLDVTKIVTKWINKPKYNHGLGLVVKDKGDQEIVKGHPDLFKNREYTPFLELDLLPMPKIERNPACTVNETRCCRNVVKIKAQDIFPQIIAPDQFELNFCSGSCDDPAISPVNTYTRMIQSFRWRTDDEPLRNAIHFCCAPIAFRAQSILLYRAGNIIKYDVPDLIPTACGCI